MLIIHDIKPWDAKEYFLYHFLGSFHIIPRGGAPVRAARRQLRAQLREEFAASVISVRETLSRSKRNIMI